MLKSKEIRSPTSATAVAGVRLMMFKALAEEAERNTRRNPIATKVLATVDE
jgi:hypothetical protein